MSYVKISKFHMAMFLLTLALIFSSCQSSHSGTFQSNGIITGPDYRMCACCGGYYIVIDTTTYDFDSLPKDANFSLQNATFPIFVKLDWKQNPDGCGNYIEILSIEKVR